MIKIVFTGSVGSGKTAAIQLISDVDVVSTDVNASDELAQKKEKTTVAMDYGECVIDEETTLALFGTPGQERFRFMWEILAKGALGFIVMVDNSRPDPLADLDIYLENFAPHIDRSCVVVGITHTDVAPAPDLHTYQRHLARQKRILPVFSVDARERGDVMLLLETLLRILDVQSEVK